MTNAIVLPTGRSALRSDQTAVQLDSLHLRRQNVLFGVFDTSHWVQGTKYVQSSVQLPESGRVFTWRGLTLGVRARNLRLAPCGSRRENRVLLTQ